MVKIKKRYLKIFVFIIALCQLFVFYRYNLFIDLAITNKIPNKKSLEAKIYNTEWVVFNNQIYIRYTAGFYFYDEDTAEVLVITERKNFKHLSCEFYVRQKYLTSSNVKSVSIKTYVGSIKLELFSFKCHLNHTRVTLYSNIQLYLKDNQINVTTTKPLPLKIRAIALKKKHIKTPGRFLLCSRYLYINSNFAKKLEAWIKLNLKFGYEKIVLFNLSIANDPSINKMFKSYKGLYFH